MTDEATRYLRKAAEALDDAHRLAKIGGPDQVERARVFHDEADKWTELARLAECRSWTPAAPQEDEHVHIH